MKVGYNLVGNVFLSKLLLCKNRDHASFQIIALDSRPANFSGEFRIIVARPTCMHVNSYIIWIWPGQLIPYFCCLVNTMADLRRISYLNGNEFIADATENSKHPHCDGGGRSKLQEGFKKLSYELASVSTQKNGTTEIYIKNEVPAVVVRNASKSYKKGVPVLQNLSMTVQQGAM